MNLKSNLKRKAAAILGLTILITMLASQMAGAWWLEGLTLIWRGGW